MAVRQVIKIDQDKCVGCGLCASACHEGAIAIIDKKATLLRDDYCDGLGNCLPHCPTGAITFEQREAAEYNREVAPKRVAAREAQKEAASKPLGGCPGSMAKAIVRETPEQTIGDTPHHPHHRGGHHHGHGQHHGMPLTSQLQQWPVQIKLVPITAPYFDNAKLLIAADCSAYAYASFHQDFIKGKVTIIGCPKLDEGDYQDKLTDIIRENNIKSVTIVRMEVPCCGGLERSAIEAMKNSGKFIPWEVITISTDGRIIE